MKYTNETAARAHVMESEPVGVLQPGMRPTKLLMRMKKNRVASKGTCFSYPWPMTSLAMPPLTKSSPYSTMLANRPFGTSDRRRDATSTTTSVMAKQMNIQNTKFDRPSEESPTM